MSLVFGGSKRSDSPDVDMQRMTCSNSDEELLISVAMIEWFSEAEGTPGSDL